MKGLLRLEKKVLVVCLAGCAVVSVVLLYQFLVLAITTGKNKSSSRLSGGLCCCVSFWFWREIGSFLLWRESFITTGKKNSSHLSGGGSFFVVAGKFHYD